VRLAKEEGSDILLLLNLSRGGGGLRDRLVLSFLSSCFFSPLRLLLLPCPKKEGRVTVTSSPPFHFFLFSEKGEEREKGQHFFLPLERVHPLLLLSLLFSILFPSRAPASSSPSFSFSPLSSFGKEPAGAPTLFLSLSLSLRREVCDHL